MKNIILVIFLVIFNSFGLYLTKWYKEKNNLVSSINSFEIYKKNYIKNLVYNIENEYEHYYKNFGHPSISIPLIYDTLDRKNIYELRERNKTYLNELKILDKLKLEKKEVICSYLSLENKNRKNLIRYSIIDSYKPKDPCTFLIEKISEERNLIKKSLDNIVRDIEKLK